MKIKGVSKLIKTLNTLKETAGIVNEHIEEKRDWMTERSDEWQESEKADEWEEYLNNLEDFIAEIEDLEVPEE